MNDYHVEYIHHTKLSGFIPYMQGNCTKFYHIFNSNVAVKSYELLLKKELTYNSYHHILVRFKLRRAKGIYGTP